MSWGSDMIRYNKKITLKKTHTGFVLETDRGDIYNTSIIGGSTTHPITDWFEKNAQTELRKWQMDAILKEYWRLHGPLDLFLVFKKGMGYSQPHDILLARDTARGIWILSTNDHTWLAPDNNGTEFNVDLSLGSVNSKEDRSELYKLLEAI